MMNVTKGKALLSGAITVFNNHVRQLAPSVAMASSASDLKPFHYQDILELQSKHDVPYKKLTGLLLS